MELTGQGGEGMVVKPLGFIHKGRQGLSQPAGGRWLNRARG
jgi:protein phosphatase